MQYEELIVLLPCYSLEDFPLHHEGDEAEGLLAGWSALWHPALVAAAGATPGWHRAGELPESLAGRLVVVPEVSEGEVPADLDTRAEAEGAVVVRGIRDRAEIVAAALDRLDGGDRGVDAEVAADFLALGYCYLQVELLTRHMRYSSSLDETYFEKQLVDAARSAVKGDDPEETQRLLASCFDILAEEADHYYPVDVHLLDLTLVAPTTMGTSLRAELASPTPINLLVSADVIAQMANRQPESLAAVREAIASGAAAVIGGEMTEGPLPLCWPETVLAELRRGSAVFRTHLGRAAHVFGRRRYGLSPLLPQILHRLGFTGALHATLDDGKFPEAVQTKTRWQGVDGTMIDAVAHAPLDATRPEAFLNFAIRMGEAMDTDHVATLVLAHWPGRVSRWYDDLRRIARFGSALGRFVTVDRYFQDTEVGTQYDEFHADLYRSPYLKQAVGAKETDPISRYVRYYRRRASALAQQSLAALAGLVRGEAPPDVLPAVAEVDRLVSASENGESEPLDEQLADALSTALAGLSAALPHGDQGKKTDYLVANPYSFVRRVLVDVPQLAGLPSPGKPIHAAAESAGRKRVVVDVPPMGFAWVRSGDGAKGRPDKVLADESSLRNEYFEARINPTLGTLQSIRDYHSRGNRLSQQIALRLPHAGSAAGRRDEADRRAYTIMACDAIEVTVADTALGEIATRGRLVDRQGKTMAGYRQTYRLWRGSRVLHVEIEIDPEQPPGDDPWNSYYACRFAWADETAEVYRNVGMGRQKSTARRLEAPFYVELETAQRRTAILTGGLPYHRRIGERMLDSLLIVRGERARTFHLGIAIDATHPIQDALSLLAPPTFLASAAPDEAKDSSGWLFHLDAKNVLATHWEPLAPEGKLIGFRVRLLETSGRPARPTLRCFRPVASARQIDFRGEPLGDCQVQGDEIKLELTRHQWVEVEARW